MRVRPNFYEEEVGDVLEPLQCGVELHPSHISRDTRNGFGD